MNNCVRAMRASAISPSNWGSRNPAPSIGRSRSGPGKPRALSRPLSGGAGRRGRHPSGTLRALSHCRSGSRTSGPPGSVISIRVMVCGSVISFTCIERQGFGRATEQSAAQFQQQRYNDGAGGNHEHQGMMAATGVEQHRVSEPRERLESSERHGGATPGNLLLMMPGDQFMHPRQRQRHDAWGKEPRITASKASATNELLIDKGRLPAPAAPARCGYRFSRPDGLPESRSSPAR